MVINRIRLKYTAVQISRAHNKQFNNNRSHPGPSSQETRQCHGCVGQVVARLEGEVILAALARRVKRIEFTGEPVRRLNNTLRIRLAAAAADAPEREMLECTASPVRPTSRLSCQLAPTSDDLNLTVHLPQSQQWGKAQPHPG